MTSALCWACSCVPFPTVRTCLSALARAREQVAPRFPFCLRAARSLAHEQQRARGARRSRVEQPSRCARLGSNPLAHPESDRPTTAAGTATARLQRPVLLRRVDASSDRRDRRGEQRAVRPLSPRPPRRHQTMRNSRRRHACLLSGQSPVSPSPSGTATECNQSSRLAASTVLCFSSCGRSDHSQRSQTATARRSHSCA